MAKRKGWMGIKRREIAEGNNVLTSTISINDINVVLTFTESQIVKKISAREIDAILSFTESQIVQKISAREIDAILSFTESQIIQKIGIRELISTESILQTIDYVYVPKPFTGQLGTATSKLSSLKLGVA